MSEKRIPPTIDTTATEIVSSDESKSENGQNYFWKKTKELYNESGLRKIVDKAKQEIANFKNAASDEDYLLDETTTLVTSVESSAIEPEAIPA